LEFTLETVAAQTGVPYSTLTWRCRAGLIDAREGRSRASGRSVWLVPESELVELESAAVDEANLAEIAAGTVEYRELQVQWYGPLDAAGSSRTLILTRNCREELEREGVVFRRALSGERSHPIVSCVTICYVSVACPPPRAA
jgi:hypothetical protein